MKGLGLFTWPDGRTYKGFYHEDKKTGLGIFTWADGRSFRGFWKEGKQHGIGIYKNSSGKEKYGEWIMGKRNKWIDEADALTLNTMKEIEKEYGFSKE